jgi:transposase InsO family protein
LHCDVWTTLVVSNSGYKFYLVILDVFTHFTWTFPLCHKSDVMATLISFHAFVLTQFNCPISCIQIDNDKEFDNIAIRSFLAAHGMVLRLTCPYTSQHNGRAERTLHTLNDSVHTMLLHTNVPMSFWPDELTTTTYLLNCRPYCVRNNCTPYQLLLGTPPDYNHLRVFGCRCYPNTTATAAHKLTPSPHALHSLHFPHVSVRHQRV